VFPPCYLPPVPQPVFPYFSADDALSTDRFIILHVAHPSQLACLPRVVSVDHPLFRCFQFSILPSGLYRSDQLSIFYSVGPPSGAAYLANLRAVAEAHAFFTVLVTQDELRVAALDPRVYKALLDEDLPPQTPVAVRSHLLWYFQTQHDTLWTSSFTTSPIGFFDALKALYMSYPIALAVYRHSQRSIRGARDFLECLKQLPFALFLRDNRRRIHLGSFTLVSTLSPKAPKKRSFSSATKTSSLVPPLPATVLVLVLPLHQLLDPPVLLVLGRPCLSLNLLLFLPLLLFLLLLLLAVFVSSVFPVHLLQPSISVPRMNRPSSRIALPLLAIPLPFLFLRFPPPLIGRLYPSPLLHLLFPVSLITLLYAHNYKLLCQQ
jgi:hypothetical protein